MTKGEIDEICESMILDYMKKTSQTYIKCVDIEGFLIDYLKCTLIYENIAEPDDANKMAFKANGVKPLHIRDSSGKIKQVVYPANTIVLDKYFLAYERSAARRFTIGHECGHVVKERLYQTECCASYYRDASVASSIPSEEICEYFKMEESQASNCISKKVRVNRGEMAKYLITNNHPAIVSRDVFQAVQSEMARRTSKHKVSDYGITEQGKYSGKYALSEKLFCGECGSVYRRKMWKIGGKRKPVWRCLNRLEHGTQFCHDSITLDEDKLHQAICIGLNQVSQVKEKALDLISTNLMYAVTGDSNIMDAYAIEQTISRVKAEMDNAVEKCSKTEGDVSRFLEGIGQLNQQLVVLREQLAQAKKQSSACEAMTADVERIKKMLSDDDSCIFEYAFDRYHTD